MKAKPGFVSALAMLWLCVPAEAGTVVSGQGGGVQPNAKYLLYYDGTPEMASAALALLEVLPNTDGTMDLGEFFALASSRSYEATIVVCQKALGQLLDGALPMPSLVYSWDADTATASASVRALDAGSTILPATAPPYRGSFSSEDRRFRSGSQQNATGGDPYQQAFDKFVNAIQNLGPAAQQISVGIEATVGTDGVEYSVSVDNIPLPLVSQTAAALGELVKDLAAAVADDLMDSVAKLWKKFWE